MQKGNSRPVVKVKPKKSWEIEYNLCGSTPAREPKTMWNDDQPLLPIHLIDGNPETAWSSRGQAAADTQPEWIRIDLPAESMVASVGLVCSEYGPSGLANLAKTPQMILGVGKSLPGELTINLSQDGKSWNTVYSSHKNPKEQPNLRI
ncbi:MAG: discoidin domain-containing protein [Chloroflexi bacterium]|nr:discoidin domain-containing protein [Chloroflexota bacterium]